MPIAETIDRIERDLDRDRAALATALSDLRGSLTLRGFAAQAVETAAAHPVPAAAAAASLGLMAARKLKPDTPPAPELAPWMAEADTLRARAAGILEQVDAALRDGKAPRADLLARREEVLAALSAQVRAVLARGLEDLPPAERSRTLATREADYAAHLGATPERANPGGSAAKPLLMAALVAGAGAALALLMPRSALEDRLIGDSRERLLAEAGGLIRSQAHRAGYLAQALVAVLDRGR